MLTRRRQKKEERDAARLHRRIIVRSLPQRFINPSKTYRIFDNFYIDEDMLMNGTARVDILASIFNWNRVTEAALTEDYIRLKLTPLQRSFELPPKYVVDRFKSFGEVSLYDMANKIEELVHLSAGYKQEESSLFESNRNLLEKRKGSAYLMMEGEITATTTRMSHFVISRELCLKLGYSEEGLMQLAVKQGSPPMKFVSTSTYYAEQCQGFITLMAEYRRLARLMNASGIERVSSMARSLQQFDLTSSKQGGSQLEQFGKCSVDLQIISPAAVLLDFREVTLWQTDMGTSEQLSTDIEEEEMEVVQHLLKIPRYMLPQNRRKICKYRHKRTNQPDETQSA